MNRLKAAIRYINYYFVSKTKHAIHPPFTYTLLTKVILDKKFKEDYIIPETIRKEMLKSKRSIEVKDLGAGSKENYISIRKIKRIAAKSAKPPKYAQLIYRISKHFQPTSIIELGTSLGITTAYLAQSAKNSKIISIEGCEKTSVVAKQNLSNHNFSNVVILNDNFDNALPLVLNDLKNIDFVFFDGNHRKDPTLKYFELCLQYVNNDSVFIFDDIHWSQEMENAWEIIKQNNKVTLSLDFHFLGIIFFRKELSKQDFVLRFY